MGEHKRQLGGGTGVPRQGIVALGLGKRVRVSTGALAHEREPTRDDGRRLIDEDVPWMTNRARAQMLKRGMGVIAYNRALSAGVGLELRKCQASRKRVCADATDRRLMPGSMEEAVLRARMNEVEAWRPRGNDNDGGQNTASDSDQQHSSLPQEGLGRTECTSPATDNNEAIPPAGKFKRRKKSSLKSPVTAIPRVISSRRRKQVKSRLAKIRKEKPFKNSAQNGRRR